MKKDPNIYTCENLKGTQRGVLVIDLINDDNRAEEGHYDSAILLAHDLAEGIFIYYVFPLWSLAVFFFSHFFLCVPTITHTLFKLENK